MTLISDDDRYSWRETYFVVFDSHQCPALETVQKELLTHVGTLKILDGTAKDDGSLATLTVASYEDHSGLEIVYHEGDSVHAEIGFLADTLEKGCTPKEKELFRETRKFRAKFEIQHFEQTAGTEKFKIVKMPVLKFAPNDSTGKARGGFSNSDPSAKLNQLKRFYFDPNSYENCVNNGAGAELDRESADWNQQFDSGVGLDSERIDPNTLILVLEILCRLSHGVAIDPACGIINR